MSPDAMPAQAVFAQCQTCGGKRFVAPLRLCPMCHGLGAYVMEGKNALYWEYGLDALHILVRRWDQILQKTIDGFLFLLLALNLFLLYRIGALVEFDPQSWLSLLFRSPDSASGGFWFISIFNAYLFYRIYRTFTSRKGRIDYRVRNEKPRKINISEVMEPALAGVLDDLWSYVQSQRQFPIRPMQLLLVLLENRDIEMIFARLGVPLEKFADALRRQIAYYPPLVADSSIGQEVKDIFLNAYLNARSEKSPRMRATDALLSCVLADQKIQEILYDFSLDLTKVGNVVKWVNFNNELIARYRHYRAKSMYKPKGPINRSYTAAATPFLDSFSVDLTQQARDGQLPLTVSREKEMEELFRIMEGGKSVLIVGEKGVGKNNLVGGLASRMVAEEVPPMFQDKRLVSLSLPYLVAGAARTGEVQERMLLVVQEVIRSGNIILVIDGIHNLVGVSSAGTENIDLSEVLSQQIQNGNVWVVATTTPQAMTELVEGSALAGFLERLPLREPDKNQAIQILESHVGLAEAKHHVFFSYEALEKIIDFANRYLHDQFLPAKAINLMNEVASWISKRESKLITGEDIAALVSRKTNIPLTKVSKQESDVLLNLEQIMHQRIVGQDEAVKLVVSALRRARAELRDPNKPIVNLLFLGPTGVGKTELAKTIAASYFNDENAMIRLDMSEYQQQDSIGRLLGMPGSGRGGILTESVRTKPFSLVLLDEVEKAHPDILNIFLQVMDDGRLTDAMGRTIDFTNVILVATSNAQAQYIQDEVRKNTPIEQIKETLLRDHLRHEFRPEFLNRFDGIVVFKPLTKDEVLQIAGLMLAKVAKRIEAKGVSFTISPEAQLELATAGFDPVFGARPLRRVIQERVEESLANYLLKGSLDRRDEVHLEPGGRITVKKAQKL